MSGSGASTHYRDSPGRSASPMRHNTTPRGLFLLGSGHEAGDELAHGHRRQRISVGKHREDRFGLFRAEMRRNAGLEFLDQLGAALLAPLAMADGEIHLYAPAGRPVLEEHLHRVADVALARVVVLLRE